MNFEALESRKLFADIAFFAVPQVTSRGSLYIEGTAGNDRITVTRGEAGINVNVNGQIFGYGNNVKRLFVNTQAGDDRVTIKIARRSNLAGGAGNNTLIGGAADDLLDGGTGSNRLFGRGGANEYLAASGSNVISSERRVGQKPDHVSFGAVRIIGQVKALTPDSPESVITTSAGTTYLKGESITFTLISTPANS